jgi:hypothetical protein
MSHAKAVDMSSIESEVDEKLASLEARLELWAAKLKEHIAKGNVLGQQAKVEYLKRASEFKDRLESAQRKLNDAKAAGSEKWGGFQRDMEKTWNDLEAGFKRLFS